MSKVRFALLGTGHWAATVHGPGLVAHPDVDLVAVWGRDAGRAAALAGELGCRGTSDPVAILGDVDAVAVALPPDVQARMAEQAAAAGRHLLLDKPLAFDVPAATAVASAAATTGVATVVFFTARFSPGLGPWWDQLARGGWSIANYVELGSIFVAGSPYATSAWRRERGALWDIGPHALATVTAGLGPVDNVAAVRGPGDTVVLTTAHRNGGTGSMILALDAPPAARERRATFYGERGVLHRPEDPTTVADAYRRAVDDLLLAIRSGDTAHPCDVRFGLDVMRVLAAAEQAAAGTDGR